MERTAITLGGVELGSSVMNASGARSAERGEIYELAAVHRGAVLLKSCSAEPLATPDNLKNGGIAHFVPITEELAARGKTVIASVVGSSEDEFVKVAIALDRAGARILELNLADDYVLGSVAPFASLERLKSLIGRVRGETSAPLAVKVPAPQKLGAIAPRTLADLFKAMRVRIAVCANDLPKDLRIAVQGAARPLSQVHAFFMASEDLLDVEAVGGINTGRDAYVAHLCGARAVQVGSALMKEGAGALGRIDRELEALLAEQGKRSVTEIIGTLRFAI